MRKCQKGQCDIMAVKMRKKDNQFRRRLHASSRVRMSRLREFASHVPPTTEVKGLHATKFEYSDSSAERYDCFLDSYTYEDYIRDFELDYLGFDGVPGEPAPDLKDR